MTKQIQENLENSENSKDDTYFKICNAVMKLEISKGHLLWRLSDIAKEADVTRSLIYYYFGKEKEVILEEALRFMIDLFFNLDRKGRLGLIDRLNYVLDKMRSMPWVFIIFYMQKDQDTELGRIIRTAEKKLFKILKDDYPEKTEVEILRIYIMQLGSVSYKSIEAEDISKLFS